MNENKKIHVYLGILILCVILGFCIWYIFGQGVPSLRSGADAIRTELCRTGNFIDSGIELAGTAEERIAGTEDAIRDSIERTRCIEERDAEIEDKLRRSLRFHRESQFIIRGIRKRSQANSEENR